MISTEIQTIVIALGGNALSTPHGDGSVDEQRAAIRQSANEIVKIYKQGWRVVLTHGNGPQIGRLLLQQEHAKGLTPPLPFDICGAMTQGQIGYLLQLGLQEVLHSDGIENSAVTLLTQVVVHPKDPAFQNPTKPVGPFYSEVEANELHQTKKFSMKKMGTGDRPYRRVVPSPKPLKIVEEASIRLLVEAGHLVIACGGGGVPVICEKGRLRGVEAVIDKDLAAERMASMLGAEVLLILTDVERVAIRFGKPDQQDLKRISLSEAKRHMASGEFPAGSMGPKIEAAIRFLESGGKRAVITSLEKAQAALDAQAGTEILP
ncbi:carbamate kinase [Candidatus Acetothermia bacterium]|nr:carbamate kinase [Candidatus Acetothermia bacterium]MBI3643628.1 carbamate kinase [Candidatus Acetothermia bacterium]